MVPSTGRIGKFLCRVFDLWYQDWVSENYHSTKTMCAYCLAMGPVSVPLTESTDLILLLMATVPGTLATSMDWLIENRNASSDNASADGQQYNYGKFSTVGSEKPEEYEHCPMADFVMVAARMIGSQMTPEHTTIFVLLSAHFWIILSPAYVKSP